MADGLLKEEGGSWWQGDLIDTWFVHLLFNCLSYVTIILPVWGVAYLLKKCGLLDTPSNGVTSLLRLLINGHQTDAGSSTLPVSVTSTSKAMANTEVKDKTVGQRLPMLIFCSIGLLGSYVIWGIYQERLMAIEYDARPGIPGERFRDSEFLVFANRISALCLSLTWLVCTRRLFSEPSAPIKDYSYASLSNILSSWFQYEVLKYVIFPVLVLAKSCKIIPVMIMGKFVNKQSYSWQEYLTAALISLGVALFFFASPDGVLDDQQRSTAGFLSGLLLVSGYMIFDSFTSNWQGHIFRTQHVSSLHMMAGVNLCSVVFTVLSLGEQGGFGHAIAFARRHPVFLYHVSWQALTSAIGQLFIFKTISEFGPVVFTTITTFRQALSILLSCMLYSHSVSLFGLFGLLIAFGAIFGQNAFGKKGASKPTAKVESITKTNPSTNELVKV